ncbi:MAG: hypothetical protein CMJ31_02105 [Phycisphaerae bacterium]|nr:hypothetical protein [Phycisphaerae bacterium]
MIDAVCSNHVFYKVMGKSWDGDEILFGTALGADDGSIAIPMHVSTSSTVLIPYDAGLGTYDRDNAIDIRDQFVFWSDVHSDIMVLVPSIDADSAAVVDAFAEVAPGARVWAVIAVDDGPQPETRAATALYSGDYMALNGERVYVRGAFAPSNSGCVIVDAESMQPVALLSSSLSEIDVMASTPASRRDNGLSADPTMSIDNWHEHRFGCSRSVLYQEWVDAVTDADAGLLSHLPLLQRSIELYGVCGIYVDHCIERQEYSTLHQQLDEWQELHGAHWLLSFYRGELAFAEGEYDDAAVAYSESLDLRPTLAAASALEYAQWTRDRDAPVAIERFRSLAADHPGSSAPWIALCEISVASGDAELLREALDELFERDMRPESRAAALMTDGIMDAHASLVRRYVDRMLADTPDSSLAHIALARACYELGDFDEASTAIDTAFRLPHEAGAAFDLRGSLRHHDWFMGLYRELVDR